MQIKSLILAVTCDVYRQQWIGNSRSKGLNKSDYPTSEEMYRRTDCSACVSKVDEGGVEMTCAEQTVNDPCKNMDLLVGGSVVCNGYGDCCCQVSFSSKFVVAKWFYPICSPFFILLICKYKYR